MSCGNQISAWPNNLSNSSSLKWFLHGSCGNQISTWAMWKSDFWSLVQLVISRIFWKCMEIYQWPSLILIACPSAWSIQVSFFYVPKNYPKRIREKKQSPWTIQILSQNFFLNLAMFKIFSMSQELSEEKKQTPWTIQIVSDTLGT